MPFYEYECSACGNHLEAMQKVSDAPLRKCPECGRQKLVRLISAPVFRLKGAGWYETDFKSEAERKRNLAEHPPEKEADKKSEDTVKSEDKPKETAEKPVAEPKSAKPKVATGTKATPAKSVKKKAVTRKPGNTASRRAAGR